MEQCAKEEERRSRVRDRLLRGTRNRNKVSYSDSVDICDARGEEMHNDRCV